MFKKINLFLFLLFLSMNGCMLTSSSHFYVLSTPSEVRTVTYHKSIGVEQITVPKYLFKREVAIAHSKSEISFFSNATWVENLNDGLTQRVIHFLQKRFDQPNIYAYPWEATRQPYLKIKVRISRFIAFGGKVYLDANWEIETLATKRYQSKLFRTTVQTKEDAASIVSSMDTAFARLEIALAKAIQNIP